MTACIGRVFSGFFHRVSHRRMGRQHWRGRDSGWVYPPLEDAIAEAGLLEVDTYVSRHQNTVTQFIGTRHIMELCLAADKKPGSRVAKRWWQKNGLDLEGMRTADREAESTEEWEVTDRSEGEH